MANDYAPKQFLRQIQIALLCPDGMRRPAVGELVIQKQFDCLCGVMIRSPVHQAVASSNRTGW